MGRVEGCLDMHGFMEAAREDMGVFEVTEEGTEERTKWGWKIRCGDP